MLKTLLVLLIGAFSAPLAAGQDWLTVLHPRPLESGQMELGVRLGHSERQTWRRGAELAWMRDADGQIKGQRLIEGEAQLRWQVWPALELELALPGVLAEFSPLPPSGFYHNFRLDDPALKRNDGFGDLRLGARGPITLNPEGVSAGWILQLTAPTGMGPLEASQPLAATGQGRWQVQAGFSAGLLWGTLQLWAQSQARLQVGRESDVSAAAPLSYDVAGPIYAPRAGALWLSPRWGSDSVLGLGWDWHRDETSRHSIGIELVGSQLQGLGAGDSFDPVGGTDSATLALVPQLHARFGRFHALGGWQAPFLYATNVPAPDLGALLLRIDYGL